MDEKPEKSSAEQLGNEALAFIEHLHERYGEDFTIGETMLIAEVIVERGEDELSCLEYVSSDPRRYAQIGLLTAALHGATKALETDDLPEHDDPEDFAGE